MTSEPHKLDELERTGATRFGFAVRRVWLELADGRMVKAELPMGISNPVQLRPIDPLEGFPELCREIYEVLSESPDWLQGAEVARRINADVIHTEGPFRRAIKRLTQAGIIVSNNPLGYRLAVAPSNSVQ